MGRGNWLVVVAYALAPAAGSAADGEVGVALKVGFNGSRVTAAGPDAFETRREAKIAGGVSVPIALGERLAFEPELLFAELGLSSDDFGVEARIVSRAVLIPLGLKALLAAGRARPHLAAGPQLAFIGPTRRRFGVVEEDISDEIRDVDFQVFVGAGIDVGLGRGRLGLEVRHSWGLRDLDVEAESTVKLRSFFLLLGYRF